MAIKPHADAGSPTAMLEYVATRRSNAKPAYARSFKRGNPGTTMAITPNSLATPKNG